MAHPFFGGGDYPWHLLVAREFHAALSGLFNAPGQIDVLYKGCGADLPSLYLTQKADLIWHEALIALAPRGGIEKLVDSVRTQFQKTSVNSKILQDVVDTEDPREAVVYPDGMLVLDRKPFRAQLSELELQQGSKGVLLVRGGRSSGKTWSRFVFQGMAQARGAEPIYLCEGLIVTVEDTVDTILAALGTSLSKELSEKNTTDSAWYVAACNRIQAAAVRRQKQVWIAVDDLGPATDGVPKLDTAIKDFFDQFALRMVNPTFQQWFRLLLIDYPEGRVSTRWKKGYWAEDRANEADVQLADVEEGLRMWASKKGRTIVESDLKDLAAKAIAKAEIPLAGDARPRLERIFDAVMEAANKL
jgi:hypothetical protein